MPNSGLENLLTLKASNYICIVSLTDLGDIYMHSDCRLMSRCMRSVGVFALVVLCCVSSNFAEDAKRGRALYDGCTACHGSKAEGNRTLKAPAIAGLPDWYLKTQIQNFKNGLRGAHAEDTAGLLMRPMAKTLATETDVNDVVAYISSLDVQSPPPTFTGDAEAGKITYMICTACHGDRGQDNLELKSPPIRQMPDWYMLTQLQHFKSGIRGADARDVPGAQMRGMSMTLADEQAMKNVIEYIKSLSQDNHSE